MYEVIVGCLEIGYDIWNVIVDFVFLQLSQRPDAFASGALWNAIAVYLPFFAAIAGTIYVLFLLLGFYREMTDIREVHWMDLARLLALAVMGNFLIQNFSTVILTLFESAGNLISQMGSPELLDSSLSEATKEAIDSVGFWWQILLILLSFVLMIVMAVCAFGLLFVIYQRFINILLLVPLGVFACACMGMGRSGIQMTGQYFKNLISVLLEGAVIILALVLSAALSKSGFSVADGLTDSAILQALARMLEAVFFMVMTLAVVRGGQHITAKALGFSG